MQRGLEDDRNRFVDCMFTIITDGFQGKRIRGYRNKNSPIILLCNRLPFFDTMLVSSLTKRRDTPNSFRKRTDTLDKKRSWTPLMSDSLEDSFWS